MRIIDLFDRFYVRIMGDDFITLPENTDDWQFAATIETIRPITSSIQWPQASKVNARARFVGGLVGHSVSHYHSLCTESVWSAILEAMKKFDEALVLMGGEPEPLDSDENPFVAEKPRFDRTLARALRQVARQSITEQTVFFEGYTKALRRGSLSPVARGVAETTRTSAYVWLALLAPVIHEHCHSVHDVHRVLEALLGRQMTGTIKRTEAICKSIGLRFRNPGRPPSIESPTLAAP